MLHNHTFKVNLYVDKQLKIFNCYYLLMLAFFQMLNTQWFYELLN